MGQFVVWVADWIIFQMASRLWRIWASVAMSPSFIREAGGERTVLAAVTVPVSWMWTLCSGMVSRMWTGVVSEKRLSIGKPSTRVVPSAAAGN